MKNWPDSNWFHGLIAGLCSLAVFPAQAANTVPHVFQICVDGMSTTNLAQEFASNPEAYPTFLRLMNEGVSTLNARCDYFQSETIPNHASMLTGRPAQQSEGLPATAHHGYTDNFSNPDWTFHEYGNPNLDYITSVFDVAHDHGLSTAFFAGKAKLAICYVSYDEIHGAPDTVDEDNGRNKVDFKTIVDWSSLYPNGNCEVLMNIATNYLFTNAPNYLFLHMADLDYTGHYQSFGSEAWYSILRQIDDCLGSLLAAIERNPELSGQTTLIVTADHGGGVPLNNHTDPIWVINYTIPFMIWGPGWPRDVNAYDQFANRFDPGTNRVDYVAARQPLRNGDAPNLALALLGLPPIPGSLMHAELGPKAMLTMHNSPSGAAVSWPRSLDGYQLEGASILRLPDSWQTITNGIMDDGQTKTYTVSPDANSPFQFFRLRRLAP